MNNVINIYLDIEEIIFFVLNILSTL